jgi:Sec-independent protein secretion pathway component TatC
MQIGIVIIALLIVGALVGSALNFAGVFLGIPLVFLFIGLVITKEALDRQRKVQQMRRFRDSARVKKVEFSEADKRTMV